MSLSFIKRVARIKNMPYPGSLLWCGIVLLVFTFASVFGFQGCQTDTQQRDENDRLLAKIYNKSLYLSDMEGMLPSGVSGEDSSLIINAFVENWVRESSLLYEAERNLPESLDIEKLVKDYRASLLKHNYETILINEFLDSLVTKTELNEFYEKNKEQYQLETPIMRCRFIKAPLDAPKINMAQQLWNSGDPRDIRQLSSWGVNNAVVQYLEDSVWYKVDEIATYLPKGMLTIDNVKKGREFVQKDDSFVYFFKVLELVSRPEIAPLGYIEGQARKVILHKRKTKLLEEMKEKFYQEAIRKNNVKIYQ